MINKIILITLLSLLGTSLSQVYGIDISEWQGPNVDFYAVRNAGYSFVIIRAGYGGCYVDPYFEHNYNKAKAAGMNVGIYWYSYATQGSHGTLEANCVLNAIAGKQFEYPIYYDIEEGSIFSLGITNDIAYNFCTTMENNRYFCGLYASTSYLENYFNSWSRTKYSIWVAQYYDYCTYSGDYGIWQFTSSGQIPGVGGNCDLDLAYLDFPSIIKGAHLNGF